MGNPVMCFADFATTDPLMLMIYITLVSMVVMFGIVLFK